MKTILILGATSSIALSLAKEYAKEGNHLILAGRNNEELERIAKDLTIRYGIHAFSINFDALDYSTHQEFFRVCLNKVGTIDIILQAFGYLGEQQKAEQDFFETKKIIETNYVASISILNIAADYFEKRRTGIIAVLSSVAGDRGRKSNYIYGSAKAALTVYLQGLRNRLQKADVKVITLKLGFVDTKMTYGIVKDSPFMISPMKAAKLIKKRLDKRKDISYVPWYWFYVMAFIKLIPEWVFKRMNL